MTTYKEKAGSGNSAFKVDTYYHTEWLPEDELILKLDGLNMDAVYENYVRQIVGDALRAISGGELESLKESVERDKKIQQLRKQIDALQAKVRREKQLNQQMELNATIKQLWKELKDIT